MGPPSYMRSVVYRNVVILRRMTVHNIPHYPVPLSVLLSCPPSQRFNCLPNYFGCKRMTSPDVALISNSKIPHPICGSCPVLDMVTFRQCQMCHCLTARPSPRRLWRMQMYLSISEVSAQKAVKGAYQYSLNICPLHYNTDGKRRSVLKGTFPILSCQRTSSVRQTWLFSLNKTLDDSVLTSKDYEITGRASNNRYGWREQRTTT